MRPAAWRFAVLGALLFVARGAWEGAPVARPAPQGGDADALLAAAAADLGLARDDAVIERRLVRNGRFLAAGEGGAALREAAALGLAGSDLVVQRRLATRLRLAIEAAARADEPSDAELRAFVARHAERFTVPARVALTQVFLDRARGAALAGDARRLRRQLRRGEAVAGDALPIAATPAPLSAAALENLLGAAVARVAFAAPLGEWSAPVASPYGLHLLRVEARTPARLPPLDAVRGAAREGLLDERAAAAVTEALRELRGGGA